MHGATAGHSVPLSVGPSRPAHLKCMLTPLCLDQIGEISICSSAAESEFTVIALAHLLLRIGVLVYSVRYWY